MTEAEYAARLKELRESRMASTSASWEDGDMGWAVLVSAEQDCIRVAACEVHNSSSVDDVGRILWWVTFSYPVDGTPDDALVSEDRLFALQEDAWLFANRLHQTLEPFLGGAS